MNTLIRDVDFYRGMLETGVAISSSGTTGTPKSIFRSPDNIKHCNKSAIDAQEIISSSKILTVCRMGHAGGLLAQTIPALSIGATVDIEEFNAYTFVKKINSYTHTHLTPDHCKAIMKTKGFRNLDLSGIWITCGSDRVEFDMIEEFVKLGCTFMCNWGMSEIGPIAINQTFRSLEEVRSARSRSVQNATILGDTFYCDVDVRENVLYVKGDISIHGNDWFCTGDLVQFNENNELYYIGRIKV